MRVYPSPRQDSRQKNMAMTVQPPTDESTILAAPREYDYSVEVLKKIHRLSRMMVIWGNSRFWLKVPRSRKE